MLTPTRRMFPFALAALGTAVQPGAALAEMNDFGKKMLAAVPAHGDKAMGDPNAPVTMIEYASATCTHCAEFHNTVLPGIKKNYIDTGKVYFIFRELITDDLSLGAFMLMRCVPNEKYFDAVAQMFSEQDQWARNVPKEGLFKIVSDAGLSTADAEACIVKEDLAKAIVETGDRARKEFNIRATPALFVNGFPFDGHKGAKALAGFIDKFLASGG